MRPSWRVRAQEHEARPANINAHSVLRTRADNNAINYAKFYSRSHDAVIHVYDDAGNVIGTQEHKGDFRDW
jgi:hypothetical protein